MNIILLHYYLGAGILVKDTAILMTSVVRPLRREFYVAEGWGVALIRTM